jgi:divalent metal cation (Fe/Co/Zn/Cd) transporter
MQQATVIKHGLKQIEEALLENADNFSVEEFSRIANSIRHMVSEQDERVFDKFLV